jgi:hypothetical protein
MVGVSIRFFLSVYGYLDWESLILDAWAIWEKRMSTITLAIWKQAESLARDFLQSGRSDSVTGAAMPYGQMQALFPEAWSALWKVISGLGALEQQEWR